MHTNPIKRVSYDAIRQIDTVQCEKDDALVQSTVDSYIYSVIPIRNLDGAPTTTVNIFLDILGHHPVFNLFFQPSLQMTRVQRWALLCAETMCGLFIDTLFFSTFYPSVDTCDEYFTQADCTAPQNKAVSSDLCFWKNDANSLQGGICRPQAPPSDVMFIMILVMITLVVTVPLTFVFDYVLTQYCSKRPDFDEWGYNTESLLGRSTQSLGDFAEEKLLSPIVALRRDVEYTREKAGGQSRFHSAAFLSDPQQSEQLAAANAQAQKNVNDATADARAVYNEFIGLQEEVDAILQDAIRYLTVTVRNQNVPWKTSMLYGNTAATALLLNQEKVRAIEKYLGVHSDGTPARLSVLDYLMYGTQTKKLLARIKNARMKAALIQKTLDGLGESELLSKDQALTQFFILEQFSIFKQYALRSELFSFAVTSALPIDPTSWLLAWVFVIGAIVFFVYWTLAWGVSTTDDTIRAWGINFTIAMAQELVLIQVFRIYVIYMISNITIKPQLTAIYRTLQRLAIEYVQDELPDAFGVIKVVQHISPACRVARLKISDNLAAGQILRHVDDNDIRSFRHAGNMGMPVLFLTIVAIPVLFGLFNDAVGDITMNTVLPSGFSMLILAHVLLWQISPLAVILPYVAIVVLVFSSGYEISTAKQRMEAMRAQTQAKQGSRTLAGWQVRAGHTFSDKMTYLESIELYIKTHAFSLYTTVTNKLAMVVYYLTHLSELRAVLQNKCNPFSTRHANERSWRAMNMPLFLHGEVLSSNKYASMMNMLRTEETFVTELPTRIARLSTDVTSRWAVAESSADASTCTRSCTSHRYLQSLLSGENAMSLLEQEAKAPLGEILQEVPHPHGQASTHGAVVVQFREKFSFCATLNGAVRKVIQSYVRQTGEGSLCFISLMDEQLLASAAEESQKREGHEGHTSLSMLNRQHSTFQRSHLLKYAGLVHVHDLALMLEEILYFYRPEGLALPQEVLREVLSRYDEWVDTVAEPMDIEVLTAANNVLLPPSPSPEKSHRRSVRSSISHHISHNISHSISHSLSHSLSRSKSHDEDEPALLLRGDDVFYRGHFQQHEMVASAMHFDQLALELKEPSPSTTPTNTSDSADMDIALNTVMNTAANADTSTKSARAIASPSAKATVPDRYSCKWRDIRLVLGAETERLQEAEKGILGAALRGLSGRQKLWMAERMSVRRLTVQPAVRLHIAHATVSFQHFVAFLRETLAAQEE